MTDAAHPLEAELREAGKRLHERYQLAARIARATWLAEETSPEAMVAATATVFIELNKQLNGHAPAPAAETLPVCECGAVMAPVVKKSPKMPDFRCPKCDHAIWNRDRKRRSTSGPT